MKVTWHRLSEQKPKKLSKIWVYYDETIKGPLCIYDPDEDCYPPDQTYWAYAELPEPPEEESHYCRSIDEHGIQWTCKDFKTPGLFHLSKRKNGLVEVEVPFCPFCGEEARYTDERDVPIVEDDDE